jgi:hypothetical protein
MELLLNKRNESVERSVDYFPGWDLEQIGDSARAIQNGIVLRSLQLDSQNSGLAIEYIRIEIISK